MQIFNGMLLTKYRSVNVISQDLIYINLVQIL